MSDVPTGSASRQFMLIVSVCIGSALAHAGSSTIPLQVGALIVASHHSASQAGAIGLAEAAALALAMILSAGWLISFRARTIALSGCAATAVANAGLYLTHSLGLQAALAALAGFGYGLVFAATVAAAASSSDPDRLYAIGTGAALLLISVVLAAVPPVSVHLGPAAVFACLTGMAVLSGPLLFTFRSGTASQQAQIRAWRLPGAAGLLVAWMCYSCGTGAVYAFSERIAAAIHLTPTQTASLLSSGMFVGLLGAGAAAAFGKRIHRPTALTLGMIGSAVSCLCLGYANSLVSFGAALFAYWIFCMFLYSYLLGTAAALDPLGRIGTLAAGLEKLAVGVGTFLGGFVAEHSSYSATGAVGFSACVVGLALGYPSIFRALARQRSLSAQSNPTLAQINL